MRISSVNRQWEQKANPRDHAEWRLDWNNPELELDTGLPLHSGRALTWLAAGQAVIQISGLLFIIYACLR